MQQEIIEQHKIDINGNPAGGYTHGVGLSLKWQDGPLGRGEDRQEPNGTFVETVLAAAQGRLEFYQTASDGKFACDENANALLDIEQALAHLEERTNAREARDVEGTHTP